MRIHRRKGYRGAKPKHNIGSKNGFKRRAGLNVFNARVDLRESQGQAQESQISSRNTRHSSPGITHFIKPYRDPVHL